MGMPSYQQIMLPLLKHLIDEEEHSLLETVEHISNEFNLSDKEREKFRPSSGLVINSRVAVAITTLIRAGLVERTRKSYFRITALGLHVLKENPPEIRRKEF